ncbi:TlpA family protein disulfide reductase [Cohnella cholangitidis]|uniref:TlpA family protein disulfide reductase n=1 Tax=Cohnella cholangitidis TaxID=2598458 RepID=A0A7G5BS41_9BACL|nr:TlpA disulfide reductase family protein [Cohnella cholangitidis]QMV39775.1 TlpA family protein disulfide reductase [Cohnella cholangitidis]
MRQRLLHRNLVRAVSAMIALVALIIVVRLFIPSDRSESLPVKGNISIGLEAPNFEGVNTNGERVSLHALRDRTVLLNFWASWCVPCVKEMPLIDEVFRSEDIDFQLVSVNVGEARGTVNEFLQQKGISFPVIIDAAGKVSTLYRIVGLPATFVIDAYGTLRQVGIGEITTREQLLSMLQT